MHIMSTNFTKTLVWKHEYDVKLRRHKVRTSNANDNHMPLNEKNMNIFCVRHCDAVWVASFFKNSTIGNFKQSTECVYLHLSFSTMLIIQVMCFALCIYDCSWVTSVLLQTDRFFCRLI